MGDVWGNGAVRSCPAVYADIAAFRKISVTEGLYNYRVAGKLVCLRSIAN
jgi:hypothetical protein